MKQKQFDMNGWQTNKKRTRAQPVMCRAVPETEIPPLRRGDLLQKTNWTHHEQKLKNDVSNFFI